VRESVVEKAIEQARVVLRACSNSLGLQASGSPRGHQEIWARDSMIALLGGVLAQDEVVRAALLRTITTLREGQSVLGQIPNLVDPRTSRANFRAYADGGLWYVVGCSIVDPSLNHIDSVLNWYRYQDVDSSGVLSMQEAADWEDLLCVRGKGLYLNCLYVAALRRASLAAMNEGDSARAAEWWSHAEKAAERINALFWYHGDGDLRPHLQHSFTTPNITADALGRIRRLPVKKRLREERYYLPYLSFRDVGEWFDTFGNLMAILSGVADRDRSLIILDFMKRCGLGDPPAKALHPVIQPGDPDWRDYYGDLNAPHRHHNGGVWPFLGGFYVAALVKAGLEQEASDALERLARLNLDGRFNEWHHGETLEPMGVECQAWSAGMLLYAAACVEAGRALYFDGDV
jgi:glycogen debranching enzyme